MPHQAAPSCQVTEEGKEHLQAHQKEKERSVCTHQSEVKNPQRKPQFAQTVFHRGRQKLRMSIPATLSSTTVLPWKAGNNSPARGRRVSGRSKASKEIQNRRASGYTAAPYQATHHHKHRQPGRPVAPGSGMAESSLNTGPLWGE